MNATTLKAYEWFVNGGNGFIEIYEQGDITPVAAFRANDIERSKVEAVARQHNAALTKAIADERERCARAICPFCAEPEHYGLPKEIEGSKRVWHDDLRNDCNGVVQCQAAAIRRDDTADTQTEGEGR